MFEKFNLPLISKFINFLDIDLTLKSSSKERELLNLTFDESVKLFSMGGISKIEDYLCAFISNPENFSIISKKVLPIYKFKQLNGIFYISHFYKNY